jgi:hypothetical protein
MQTDNYRMSDTGAVILRDLARTHPMVSVRCDRCDRAGRYRVSTLIERYGRHARLPDVASALEAGCPRKGEHGGCFVVFEELSGG